MASFVSCKDDFDELEDTDQRSITFEIYTDDFFEDFFDLPSSKDVQTNSKYILDFDHKIRLSCYCYNHNDSLVSVNSTLISNMSKSFIKIAHLVKDTEYRFEIFADVAKIDKTLEYYEAWFHLETASIDSFFLLNMRNSEDPHHDILKHAAVNTIPENNIVPIRLSPISVNSYCIFSNADETEWISGEITYSNSFFVKSMATRSRKSQKFNHINDGQENIIIPFNMASIHDTVNFQLRRIMLNKTDSLKFSIINRNNQHIVTSIDCRTLTQTSCEFQ